MFHSKYLLSKSKGTPTHLLFRLLRAPNTSSEGTTGGFWKTSISYEKKPVNLPSPLLEKSAFRFQASNFRGSMASDTELTQQVPKWTAKSLGGSTGKPLGCPVGFVRIKGDRISG